MTLTRSNSFKVVSTWSAAREDAEPARVTSIPTRRRAALGAASLLSLLAAMTVAVAPAVAQEAKPEQPAQPPAAAPDKDEAGADTEEADAEEAGADAEEADAEQAGADAEEAGAEEADAEEADAGEADAGEADAEEADAEEAAPETAEPTDEPAAPEPAAASANVEMSPTAAQAAATDDEVESEKPLTELTRSQLNDKLSLGLSPGTPQVSALPGGVSASFGSDAPPAGFWYPEFHGMVTLPLRIGINERESAGAGQKQVVLHTPPVTPGEYESFGYTSVTPDPWVQLNFSYGKKNVNATVIIAARTLSDASSYFNPPDQLGINDAYLTFRVPSDDSVSFNIDVGAFANRYGVMGEYDTGRYNTPLIARVGGVGTTATLYAPISRDLEITAEAGIQGQLNKAPIGVEPAAWNGFADPNVGSSFAPHLHGAVKIMDAVQLGLHGVYAFVQDDRATPTIQPDGQISVLGADARFTLKRFGHLYAGGSYVSADTARSVSGVVRILNAPGGPGLMKNYFGPESGGTGTLTTLGAQYDLSLANLLQYPRHQFEGKGPDIYASVFGVYASVGSEQEEFDGIGKLKYGTELTYSALSWLALSTRYDRVISDIDDDAQTSAIISPRLIFRSDFGATDQVVLQYSRWMNGNGTVVEAGYPPAPDPSIEPDSDVLSLSASMWW